MTQNDYGPTMNCELCWDVCQAGDKLWVRYLRHVWAHAISKVSGAAKLLKRRRKDIHMLDGASVPKDDIGSAMNRTVILFSDSMTQLNSVGVPSSPTYKIQLVMCWIWKQGLYQKTNIWRWPNGFKFIWTKPTKRGEIRCFKICILAACVRRIRRSF